MRRWEEEGEAFFGGSAGHVDGCRDKEREEGMERKKFLTHKPEHQQDCPEAKGKGFKRERVATTTKKAGKASSLSKSVDSEKTPKRLAGGNILQRELSKLKRRKNLTSPDRLHFKGRGKGPNAKLRGVLARKGEFGGGGTRADQYGIPLFLKGGDEP